MALFDFPCSYLFRQYEAFLEGEYLPPCEIEEQPEVMETPKSDSELQQRIEELESTVWRQQQWLHDLTRRKVAPPKTTPSVKGPEKSLY